MLKDLRNCRRASARGMQAAAFAGAALLGASVPVGHAAAQTSSTLSAQDIEQLRAELKAVHQDSEAARAQEAARERQIETLQHRLDAATGVPPTAFPAQADASASESLPSGFKAFLSGQDGRNFEIYGFAQTDWVQDFKRVNPAWDDTLRPSKIPTTPGQFGGDGQSVISARQSRFGVQAQQPIAGQDLKVKFEFDLFGVGGDEGQTTFRLRHVYGQWGPILAGQTNSVFMDGDTFPNTVDYWGPAGMVFLRNPQIRFTHKSGKSEFAIAVEKPGNDIDPGQIRELDPALGSNIHGDEKFPDLTAHYRYDGGWGHFQFAGILRRIGYDTAGTPDNQPKGDQLGWGINSSANFNVFHKDVIHLAVVYGDGIASYMNDGGTDLGPKGAPGSLQPEALELLGVTAYYDHAWSKKFSTSFGYSRTQVTNTSFQAADAFNTGQYASANLLYTPGKNILMGAEFLWGSRKDNNGATGDDLRLQMSFKYNFSSNDFFR